MGKELRDTLATIDLSSTNLDAISGLDPQMLNVLRKVKDWGNETVAHQNHGSHSDSHGGERIIERDLEKAKPGERIPAEKVEPAVRENK